jgi:propanol-preferring alcohol dehydrogenase
MLLDAPSRPLRSAQVATPAPGRAQVLLRVSTCAVCRTDLHVADGELRDSKLPLVLGHEIVGTVEARGEASERFAVGARVGVPWLGWTCGECRFCLRGQENLCVRARFTGYQIDGGYAEFTVADERFCFPLPARFDDREAAPLLCAGLIGYRTLRMAGDAARVGIYGFGAAAHLVAQVARHEGRTLFAFTRPGDTEAQSLALRLGASWAGDSTQSPPELLDAALIFAPVGALVVSALRALDRGGVVVCGGIHMSDIPSFPYELLWEERAVRSVANLTRRDGEEFFALVKDMPLEIATQGYALERANDALDDLRAGRVSGAAVLEMSRR